MSLLEIRKVSRFFGGLAALNGVDLHVEEGEVVGLAGQNGAGKTTLINVIAGIFPPSAGAVLFEGRPIHGLPPNQIARRGLARTFQLARSFSELSVEENVMVGALFGASPAAGVDAAAARARAVLELVDLLDRRAAKPGELTLAARKRLELARALATQPRLLLLDEVVAGLTTVETDEMLGCLRKVRERGVALIIIEHVLEVMLEFADRMYVLDHGEVIGEGTPADVLANAAVIEAFIGLHR